MKNEKENLEIIETSVEEICEETTEKETKSKLSAVADFFKKIVKLFKSNKIKNQALLKRGSFSLVITALVLALLIGFNWLVGTLGDRFKLEYDMTADKKNSISEDNIKYLESLNLEKSPVTIMICSSESSYLDAMISLAQEYYGIAISSYSEIEYFNQTQKLLQKYPSYNKQITVKYVDPESTEYAAISSNYADYDLFYGDMLVTATVDGNERVEHLTFEDIYVTTQDSYTYSYVLTANRLESALTSAIASVTNPNAKKAAVLSGHSNNTYAAAYIELLKLNNYDVTEIPDSIITSISSDFDIVVIAAPTKDFIGSELDIIDAFLNNEGKLGKGLIFFADPTASKELSTLYGRLKQWGIEIGEGMLFGTTTSDRMSDSPNTIIASPVALQDDDITSTLKSSAIGKYHAPMKAVEAYTYEIQTTALMQTKDTVVVSPVGAAASWSEYTDDDKQKYDCVIQAKKSDYDSENKEISSYIMAFSSVEFIQSHWANYYQLANQDMVMLATNRAAHAENIDVFFTAKVIKDESFADKILPEKVKSISTTYMVILPLAVIALGIVIFIRRRNAR